MSAGKVVFQAVEGITRDAVYDNAAEQDISCQLTLWLILKYKDMIKISKVLMFQKVPYSRNIYNLPKKGGLVQYVLVSIKQ